MVVFRYIGFLSGLGIGGKLDIECLNLCVQRLIGQIGTERQLEKMAKVCAVIIAGGLIAAEDTTRLDRRQKVNS